MVKARKLSKEPGPVQALVFAADLLEMLLFDGSASMSWTNSS
jgi:hypothetical protein